MSLTSRISDIGVGVCMCHKTPIPMTGIIVSGCTKVTVCNQPDARVGDIVIGACGHPGILVSGSPNTTKCSQATVRIGDPFVGCFTGVIVSGCPRHNTN